MHEKKIEELKKYSANDLFEDIRKNLESIVPLDVLWGGKLTDTMLSLYLGQVESHIRRKKNKGNEIVQDMLGDYELFLKSRFSLWKKEAVDKEYRLLLRDVKDKTIKFLEKYRELNNLKKYKHGITVFEHHPNLKVNYFERIDTKEKAYWLGWLFAEGWLSKIGDSDSFEFGVGCNSEDIELLERFTEEIGYDIRYRQVKRYRNKDGEVKEFIIVRFDNKEFAYWLQCHGFIAGKAKSKNIELPKLKSRKQYLSFVLGFYDGDGIAKTSEICCGSKRFLEKIKDLFNINCKITRSISEGIMPDGRVIKGTVNGLFLGADLYNEMLDNYQKSLERKRNRLTGIKQRLVQLNKAREKMRKFKLTPGELETLLWLKPMTDIAKSLGVSYGRIQHYKDRWVNKGLIKAPLQGYWRRKKNRRIKKRKVEIDP